MSYSLITALIELHLELVISILRYLQFLIFDHHRHLSHCIVLEPPSIHQTQTWVHPLWKSPHHRRRLRKRKTLLPSYQRCLPWAFFPLLAREGIEELRRLWSLGSSVMYYYPWVPQWINRRLVIIPSSSSSLSSPDPVSKIARARYQRDSRVFLTLCWLVFSAVRSLAPSPSYLKSAPPQALWQPQLSSMHFPWGTEGNFSWAIQPFWPLLCPYRWQRCAHSVSW